MANYLLNHLCLTFLVIKAKVRNRGWKHFHINMFPMLVWKTGAFDLKRSYALPSVDSVLDRGTKKFYNQQVNSKLCAVANSMQ